MPSLQTIHPTELRKMADHYEANPLPASSNDTSIITWRTQAKDPQGEIVAHCITFQLVTTDHKAALEIAQALSRPPFRGEEIQAPG